MFRKKEDSARKYYVQKNAKQMVRRKIAIAVDVLGPFGSRLFIDKEYTNGTYPTPDCKFVLLVEYCYKLSAQ